MTVLPDVSDALLSEIADRYGTPVFVLSPARLEENYRAFATALARCGNPTRVLYSVKTNYLPAVLRTLRAAGAGADVVSGYELRAALDAGFRPEDVAFNGPMKTRAEIELAVAHGVHVNIDGPAEAGHLADAARAAGRTVDVGVRVNPGRNMYPTDDPSHDDLATRAIRRSKFGWPIDTGDAERFAERVASRDGLRLTAVHCHLGAQIVDLPAFSDALDSVVAFTARLAERHPVRTLNVGGGFGVPGIVKVLVGPRRALEEYEGTRDPRPLEHRAFDVPAFVARLDAALATAGLRDVTVVSEPGRLLVSDAMLLLSRVVGVKNLTGADWVVLDAGQNLLPTVSPAEEHRMRVVGASGPTAPFAVGGPMCFAADVLSQRRELAASVTAGDLVAVGDAGAYTLSRATSFIRPRAGVVAVRDGRYEECWRPETYEDIFAFAVPTSLVP